MGNSFLEFGPHYGFAFDKCTILFRMRIAHSKCVAEYYKDTATIKLADIFFVPGRQTKTVILIPSVSKKWSFTLPGKPHRIGIFSNIAAKADTRPGGFPGRVLFLYTVSAVSMHGVIAKRLR